jgi:hypothetical protein
MCSKASKLTFVFILTEETGEEIFFINVFGVLCNSSVKERLFLADFS